jgi:hypothetical protein
MRLVATAALCLLLVTTLAAHAEDGKKPDFSPAERLLFMTPQLKNLQAPTQLRYTYAKTGSLEEAFTDKVTVDLIAKSDGTCCNARGVFLSGKHSEKNVAPDVPNAQGNPVILYFLEHDVHEMQRLTGGAADYFRTRLRMAIYQKAQVHDVTLHYQGHAVKGQEVAFSPFLDDPNSPKFEKFVQKNYHFLLSPEVPGGVYGIRTQVPGDGTAAKPLMTEEVLIDGAAAPPAA